MKYKIIPSKRFEKDMKRCQKRGYDMRLIKDAIMLLAETGTLPAEYKPHQLHFRLLFVSLTMKADIMCKKKCNFAAS